MMESIWSNWTHLSQFQTFKKHAGSIPGPSRMAGQTLASRWTCLYHPLLITKLMLHTVPLLPVRVVIYTQQGWGSVGLITLGKLHRILNTSKCEATPSDCDFARPKRLLLHGIFQKWCALWIVAPLRMTIWGWIPNVCGSLHWIYGIWYANQYQILNLPKSIELSNTEYCSFLINFHIKIIFHIHTPQLLLIMHDIGIDRISLVNLDCLR